MREREADHVRATALGVRAAEIGDGEHVHRRRAVGRGDADGERHGRGARAVDRHVGKPRAVRGQAHRRRPRQAAAALQRRAHRRHTAVVADQARAHRPRRGLLWRDADREDVRAAARRRQADRGVGLRQQRRAERRPGKQRAALGGQRLAAPLSEARQRRGQHEDAQDAERLGAQQQRARSGTVGAARPPPGEGGAERHERDEDRLDDHDAPVVRPAQEVPAVDLAHGREDAGHDRHAERRAGDGGEGPRAVAQRDAAAQRDERQRDHPAEPQPGGQHVHADVQQRPERGDGERVARERVGQQDRGAAAEVQPVAHAAAATGRREGERERDDDDHAHEVRHARRARRQQAEVELARRAGGRAGEGALDGREHDEQPCERARAHAAWRRPRRRRRNASAAPRRRRSCASRTKPPKSTDAARMPSQRPRIFTTPSAAASSPPRPPPPLESVSTPRGGAPFAPATPKSNAPLTM